MAFSWDIYFSFPTSLGKRLICGGDIFGRTRDGGNRYKAKLLGSYNRSMRSMERFSFEGLLPHPHEGRKIQFPSLVKNHPAECNSPTHSEMRQGIQGLALHQPSSPMEGTLSHCHLVPPSLATAALHCNIHWGYHRDRAKLTPPPWWPQKGHIDLGMARREAWRDGPQPEMWVEVTDPPGLLREGTPTKKRNQRNQICAEHNG